MNNYFKIVAGKYKSRKLNFTNTIELKPTTSKIREILFNWIQFESYNKTYLDLFSGSGSLSFEALSRGAKEVISIEKNFIAFKNIEKNIKLLNSNKIQAFNQDALIFLAKKNTKIFDFIFIDPPFNKNIIPKVLQLIYQGNFVATGSKMYIESEFKIDKNYVHSFFKENTKIIKQGKSGQVNYCLIKIL